MSHSEQTLSARFSDSQEVLRLSQGAVYAALRDHKRTGDPVAIWRDGQVVLLSSDQIELPEPVAAEDEDFG
jgi:hypothetical protein